MRLWLLAAAAVLSSPAPAQADWTARQEKIIRAANEVVEADMWAYTNSCNVADGKARYAAGTDKVKAMLPAMEKEIGSYPVYEIFVVRAPTFGPKAHPPRRCKAPKRYAPEKERIMIRFEQAVEALGQALAAD
jgi:hypothetical protein